MVRTSNHKEEKEKTYQNFSEIIGRITVSISSLNNTNLDRVNTGFMNKFSDEESSKTSNLITIQKSKDTIFSNIVKDDTIGITIIRTTSITGSNRNTRWGTLLSLYKISTTLNNKSSIILCKRHGLLFVKLTFLFNWPKVVVFSLTILTDKTSDEICLVISRSLGAPTPLAQSTCNVDKRGFPFYKYDAILALCLSEIMDHKILTTAVAKAEVNFL
jgi:hypothetical protein